MRILTIILLLAGLEAGAQIQTDAGNQVHEIALAEQKAKQRIISHGNILADITSASNNYDVAYYRCEWEVNPAVRYIAGKVTVYYTITSATNNIQMDLMNPLTVDSVKQRNQLLTRSHSNNTLSISFPATVNAGYWIHFLFITRAFRQTMVLVL